MTGKHHAPESINPTLQGAPMPNPNIPTQPATTTYAEQQQMMLAQQHQIMLDNKFRDEKKDKTTAWLLWWFTGGIGGHRYYLGKKKTAIAMTCTFGGLGFWTLIDAFKVNKMLARKNEEIHQNVYGHPRSPQQLIPQNQYTQQ